MTIVELSELQSTGQFHHATYRNFGTLWEGLWVYAKSPSGLRGFDVAGSFPKDSPELELAIAQCKGHSIGSYGNG